MALDGLANISLPQCCAYYRQTRPVANLHLMNRFGSSNAFSDLFSSDPQLKQSYVRGLVVLPIILGIIFAIWTLITLILLPCLGPKHVGFLSGGGFTIAGDDRAPSLVADNSERSCPRCADIVQGKPRRLVYTRVGCLLSLGIQLIFIIPLVTLGFNQIDNTRAILISGNEDIDYTLTVYSEALQSLYNAALTLINAMKLVVTEIPSKCSLPTPSVDENLIGNIEDRFLLANELIQQVNSTNEAMFSAVMSIETYSSYIYIYWVPLLILAILMVALLLIVWWWEDRRFIKNLYPAYVVLGLLYCLWTILSWILLVCFMAGLAVNADACSGPGTTDIPVNPVAPPLTPLGTLIAILYSITPQANSQTAELMMYYFGCVDNVPVFLLELNDSYGAVIAAGLQLLNFVIYNTNMTATTNLTDWNETALSMINSTLVDLNSVCSDNGARDLRYLAAAIVTALLFIPTYVTTMAPLLTCIYVSPIYDKMMNEAVCTQNPYAMAWIFSCLFIISVTGLTAITLRSSFVPVKFLEDAESPNNPLAQGDTCTEVANEVTNIAADKPEDDENNSSEPVSSSFFLVKKLEGAEGPCIPSDQSNVSQESAREKYE